VTSPQTADYTINLHASGGTAELRVDDIVLEKGDRDAPLHARVRLTNGVHAIKVKAIERPITIERISVDRISE
jgi:hypothetical protein